MTDKLDPQRAPSKGGDFGLFSDEEILMKGAVRQPLMDQEIPDYDAPARSPLQTTAGVDVPSPAEQAQRPAANPAGPVQTPPAGGMDLDEKPAKKKPGSITAAHLKIVASAVILIAAAVALWPAPPAPISASPTTLPTGTPGTSPVADGVPRLPMEGVPPVGTGAPPALEIATSSADEEELDRLEQDLEGILQKIAPAEQTCSNTASLTAFDRFQCGEYGVAKFYRCTEETGRMWNSDLPNCELL